METSHNFDLWLKIPTQEMSSSTNLVKINIYKISGQVFIQHPLCKTMDTLLPHNITIDF